MTAEVLWRERDRRNPACTGGDRASGGDPDGLTAGALPFAEDRFIVSGEFQAVCREAAV